MKRIKLFALLMAALVLPSCSEEESGTIDNGDNKQPPVEIALTQCESTTMKKQNNLGFRLLKAKLERDNSVSTALSPFGISQVLAMIANGAEGNVHREIVAMLSEAGTDIDEINSYYKKLNEGIATTDKSTKFELVNALWANDSQTFVDNFTKINEEYYGAVLLNLSTYKDILNWYKKNTSSDIYEAVDNLLKDEISEQLQDATINSTSYFNGEWAKKFNIDNTMPYLFYGDKSKQSIKMMRRQSRCNYFMGQHATAAQLDYGNGSYSMVVILPNKDSNVSETLNELIAGGLEQMTKIEEDVDVIMPRFEMNESFELAEILHSLGIDFFDGTYTKLLEQGMLTIAGFKQHMQMKVDENGTTVKTSTSATGGWDASGPREFMVDRSFLWLIKENSTGSILFLGKVGEI